MDKSVFVREMFASIAPRYDATNRLLTGGVDERWRRRAVRELAPAPNDRVLDLCCGTGDLAFHLVRTEPTLRVDAVDFCDPMLDGARARAPKEDVGGRIRFAAGDAMRLPFEDDAFDGATMGFAMRNVADIDRTLREVRRVLRPGGRFVNLDMSHPPNPLFGAGFRFYFGRIVPLVGGLVGGSPSAYRYLPNSLKTYPDADALAVRYRGAGFRNVRFVRLGGGAIAVHAGEA